MADEDAAHRRGDDAVDLPDVARGVHLRDDFIAEFRGNAGIAKHIGALEVAVGVELGAKLEVPAQQSVGVGEDLEDFLFCHHGLVPCSLFV